MKFPLLTFYVPGNRNDLIEEAPKYDPDAVIIDLEDTVPTHLKEKTRWEVAEIIPRLEGQCLVRINSGPSHLEEDLNAVVSKHLYGAVVPKVESVKLIEQIDDTLNVLEKERSLQANSVKILPLIESALGVVRCFEIASAAPRVDTVIFASMQDGDLHRDLKCGWSIEGTEFLYARSKVLLDARAAGLKYVLDGAFGNIEDTEALRKDCELSRRLGYDGRTLVHPKQVSIARKVYSASPQRLSYYKRMVQAFEEAEKEGLAAVTFEGNFVDYATYKKAKEELYRFDSSLVTDRKERKTP